MKGEPFKKLRRIAKTKTCIRTNKPLSTLTNNEVSVICLDSDAKRDSVSVSIKKLSSFLSSEVDHGPETIFFEDLLCN